MMHDSSPSKSISASSSSGRPSAPPSEATAAATPARDPIRAWLRPSYPPSGSLRRHGYPRASAAASASAIPPDLAPRRGVLPHLADEAPLGEPVLRGAEGGEPGAQRRSLCRGGGGPDADVLQLVGDDVAQRTEAAGGIDVVIAPDDELVRHGRRRAARVRVERDDPVAHRARREREHPAQLAAAHDPDRGARRHRRGAVGRWLPDAEPVQRVEDEPALARRVQAVGLAVRCRVDDPPLRLGVRVAERVVRAQGLAERDELGQLPAGRGHDVEMDRVRAPVVDDGAREHRPRRRERGDALLAAEAEREDPLADRGDVVRVRLDAEVHEVLARESRHRRGSDVLHHRRSSRRTRRAVRPRARPPGSRDPTGGRPPAGARTGGWAGRTFDAHSRGGACVPGPAFVRSRSSKRENAMRIVTGRTITEVDVG